MWTLDKIEQYIADGIEENIHLDYKGAGSISKSKDKKKEISKDVSAFANSDGGVIIYGVREFDEVSKTHLPEKIDPIDANEFSKEWLENIINSTIAPRISGILITPIQVNHKEVNQVIYVVEIPKGNTAHQMNDKRYYKRFNFQSLPMEDWEIKDIINRLERTQVEVILDFKPSKKYFQGLEELPAYFEMFIYARNTGKKVIKYLDLFISGDSKTADCILKPKIHGDFEEHYSNLKPIETIIGGEKVIVNYQHKVILPNTYLQLTKITLQRSFVENDLSISFQISTDDNVKYFEYRGKEIFK